MSSVHRRATNKGILRGNPVKWIPAEMPEGRGRTHNPLAERQQRGKKDTSNMKNVQLWGFAQD